MNLYIGLASVATLFIAYLYYQVKVKNNKNYPASLAMGLAFLVLVGNKSIDWLFENINSLFGTSCIAPKPLSTIEIFGFLFFLYLITGLYYKNIFGRVTQKNSLSSLFQIGNNKQINKK